MSSIAVSQNCLKSLNFSKSVNDIKAELLFPKVVIIEDTRKVRIVDIENVTLNDTFFDLEYDIIDHIVQDHFLWLILKSYEIIIIDIFKGQTVKIRSNNYSNYKIRKFILTGRKLFLMSESWEYLAAPLSTSDLVNKITQGETDLTVSLQKVNIGPLLNSPCCKAINGFNVFIEAGNLVLQCSVTGLKEIIYTEEKLENIVPWRHSVVIAARKKMWIIDIQKCNMTFQFDYIESNYYILAATHQVLYYLLWNEEKVEIFSVLTSTTEKQDSEDSFNVTANLSSQDTLKEQLKQLVDTALSNVKPAQVLPQLQLLCNNINDFTFLIDMVTKLCTYNITYKTILYSLQKKMFNMEGNQLLNLISDLIIKIDLLEYILFRGSNLYEGIDLFDKNFIELSILFISKSDLDLASICWLKYSVLKLTINRDDIVNTLNAVPFNIKLGALIIWLRNFVPPILEENPFHIDLFVKWTTERIFLLEQSSYWPKIGYKFIEEIIIVLETSIKTISIRPVSLDDLDILKDHIKYILELKEKYRINMLLSELSSQNPIEIAVIMLRRCYTEDLEDFLQNKLPSFASHHLFELDDTLRLFIENEAVSSGGNVDGIRLRMLLNAFCSTSNKLECLLQVLKVLDVPWSETILELAVKAAASANKDFTITDADRALAQEIHNELNYAKVKVILKKYNFPLTCTDYTLVLHKMVDAPSIDLNDLKIITSVLPPYTNYGTILYIDKCLQNCDTKVALEYFSQLMSKEKKLLLKSITTKYELIINRTKCDATLERNYLDFMKGTQMMNAVQINTMENLYHLKNSYSITLTINKIYDEISREKEVEMWSKSDGTIASSGRGRCVTRLVNTYSTKNSALVALLHQTSCTRKVRKILESIITSDLCGPNMISVLKTFKDGSDSALLLDSSSILSELVSKCAEEYLHYLLNRLSILNSLVNTHIILKNLSVAWKFHYIFLPISAVNTLNDLIDFYSNISLNQMHLEIICKSSEFVSFRLIAHLITVTYLIEENLYGVLLQVKNKIAKKLLAKVVAVQDIDSVLVTMLLIIINHIKNVNDSMWILDILRGQNETLPPNIMYYLTATATRHIFALNEILPGSMISYPPQYVLKLKFNIDLSEVPLPGNTEVTWDAKVILFHVLRQYPDSTYEHLFNLCRILNVSYSDGLSLLLITVLTQWDLKYKLVDDDLGRRRLNVQNDEKELILKCLIIWESIDNKDFLRDVLNNFWKIGEVILHGCVISINSYYHEVFLCIYQLIFYSSAEQRNVKDYFLLNFLKEYQRKSTPKQSEFELFSVKGMFPEIGNYRLPFHLFIREDMWTNLRSEITLETYERWLPIVAILSLHEDLQIARDMICSNAVKQTMSTRKLYEESESKDNDPWQLTSREESLLRRAHQCVRLISNMEWAGACLFYILQGCTTRSVDQVTATNLCLQFSERWGTLQPGNRAVKQLERLHSNLSIRHALHKIDWACEELIRLSTEPIQLINALYFHPNFTDKITRHDINRAANEIADKNGINIGSIRMQILGNILEKCNNETKSANGLNVKELITVKYILKATCPKMAAIYLSRIAFDDESDFDKCKKLRAFQCLMSVVDPDTALKVTNRTRDDLWSSLLEILYVVNLEKIDLPWVVATFMQNKILALNQLIQVAVGNTEGLKIAAELAYRYGNMQSIRQLIPLLMHTSLYEEIIPLLLKFVYPPDDVICAAWSAIILSPFQRADYPITERQRKNCLKVLNLLPVCPNVKDEDLVEIWKNCVRCKSLGIGCLLLPYMTLQTRQKLTELQKIDKRNLIISLKNLHTESYLVPGAMIVLENMSSKLYR